jgi:hypothetical protein
VTDEMRKEIMSLCMESHKQGSIDGIESVKEAFEDTAKITGRSSFTMTEIMSSLEGVVRNIKAKKYD